MLQLKSVIYESLIVYQNDPVNLQRSERLMMSEFCGGRIQLCGMRGNGASGVEGRLAAMLLSTTRLRWSYRQASPELCI